MIPGVSRRRQHRGGELLGADQAFRRGLVVFLAIPTFVGAFAYDFYRTAGRYDGPITSGHFTRDGFVVLLHPAMIVVKTFLDITSPATVFRSSRRGSLGLDCSS